MIVEERRLKIPGLMERVSVACEFVVDAARRAGLDERAVHHCQLAVDEACTNVIEHGYHFDGSGKAIEVVCRHESDRFSITIIDDGAPFDPLIRPDPDPSIPLEDREPGGWGIFFIKKVMDEVFYQLEANRNNLVLVKHLQRDADDEEQSPNMISLTLPLPYVRCIMPHGRLGAALIRSVAGLIAKDLHAGIVLFIVDMSDVTSMSTNALKTLLRLAQRAQEDQGDLVLAAIDARVYEMLEINGFEANFELHESVEAAAAGYAAR